MGRWRKLGVIAGGGALPARILAEREALGEPFCLVRIAGAADDHLRRFPGAECGVGEAGKILRLLKAADCDAAVFAGVVRRPDFKTLKVDWRGAALLPKVVGAAARGDGALLQVLVDTIESEGIAVVGAEEAAAGLAAPAGALGRHRPNKDDFSDMAKAAALINAIGVFDVGQAAVVRGGLVLAVEAAEGTDLVLSRCAELPFASEETRAGVLVKRPKPGQELRVDLPVVGPRTIAGAAAAGLAGVAVEAGAALVIDREAAVAAADEAGLFLYGFEAAELVPG